MGKDKKKKKVKESRNREKKSGHLKVFSSTELQDFTSARQSKHKLSISNSDDHDWQLKLFSPNENNLNSATHLTWTIGGYKDCEIKFDSLNPLMIFWKHTITVREWDSANSIEKVGVEDQVITLKPEFHNVWPWPTTGATGYFKSLRTAYNSQHSNDTEILQVANLDELNTIQTMDLFINPNEEYLTNSKDFGRAPLLHCGLNGSTYLKDTLGSTPNLNYYDNSASASFAADEGFFYSYGSLPVVPFRKFSPRMAKKMDLNSGGDSRDKLDSIIWPPKTSFHFRFEKTPSENYLHLWYWPAYTDQMGSKQEALQFKDYRIYRTVQNKEYIIKSGHCTVQNVFIRAYIRNREGIHRSLPLFDTFCTVRRLAEHKLGTNRYPTLKFFNDTKTLGHSFFIMFRRGLDLDADPSQSHPFCPSTCFRPNTLKRIKILEGGDQGGDPIVYNNMDIDNLCYKKLDFTMARYASILQRQGFITAKHSRTFWQLPFNESAAKKTASIGDVGVSNFFPFSLLSTDVRKNFVYYSTHGIRSENLLIQLEFSEPLSKIWYMIVVSEFLVSIKFNAATGAPTFKIVED